MKITAAVSRDNCSRFRVKLTCDKIGRSNVGSTKDEAGPLDILAWKISIDILSLYLFAFAIMVFLSIELFVNKLQLQRLKAKVKTEY